MGGDNKRPNLSLYIPFCNSALYLPRLIKSVSNLPSNEVELVFVDDGSQDDGRSLVEEFSKARQGVVLLSHAKRRGPGAASNTALDRARGRFVQRCDSDDEVEPDGLMEALEAALDGDCELVLQPWKQVDPSGVEEVRVRTIGRDPFEWLDWPPALCSTMIKSSLIKENKIRFPNTFSGEDGVFFLYVMGVVDPKRIRLAQSVSYTYWQRVDSVSRGSRANIADRHLETLPHKMDVLQRLVTQESIPAGRAKLAAQRAHGQGMKLLRRDNRHRDALALFEEGRKHWGTSVRMWKERVRNWFAMQGSK